MRAIAGITLLGLALRVAGLGQSLYGDELYTYRALVDHGLGDALRSVYRTEDTPPLFFVLAWAAAKAGDPTLWLRVPSLVLGTAAIPLTYLIGLRTVGRAGALIGAALLALAPFAVFYAGEARAYAALVFFVALSTLALLRVVEGGRRGWWLVLAGAVAAALMTHYTALFVVAAQAGWALWRAPALRRRLLVAHALAALPLVLLLVSGTEASVGEVSALFPLTVDTVAGQTARALAGLPFEPLRDVPGVPGAVLVAIAVIAVVAGALSPARPAAPARGGPADRGAGPGGARGGAALQRAREQHLPCAEPERLAPGRGAAGRRRGGGGGILAHPGRRRRPAQRRSPTAARSRSRPRRGARRSTPRRASSTPRRGPATRSCSSTRSRSTTRPARTRSSTACGSI